MAVCFAKFGYLVYVMLLKLKNGKLFTAVRFTKFGYLMRVVLLMMLYRGIF